MLIFPAIDIRGGQCVRLRQGDYAQETVFDADPVAVALRWAEQGAPRLHLVDLDGAKAGHPVNLEVVRRITEAVTIPCQLGGGIRLDDHVKEVFDAGVWYPIVSTQALKNPDWLHGLLGLYPERMILGIDARDGNVATEGWLESSEMSAIALARQFEESGLHAIVYTDIAKDGMMQGPNFDALFEMRHSTPTHIIASGGVSTIENVQQLHEAGTFAAIIGRALYEGSIDLRQAVELCAD